MHKYQYETSATEFLNKKFEGIVQSRKTIVASSTSLAQNYDGGSLKEAFD